MSDTGPREVTCSLGTEFDLEPGKEEDVCVDLEGEWREDSLVTKHPDLNIPNLEFVTGSVGEGGDHVNITFKNCGDEKISIDQDRPAIVIKETGAKSTETSDVEKMDTSEVVEKQSDSKEGNDDEAGSGDGDKPNTSNSEGSSDKAVDSNVDAPDADAASEDMEVGDKSTEPQTTSKDSTAASGGSEETEEMEGDDSVIKTNGEAGSLNKESTSGSPKMLFARFETPEENKDEPKDNNSMDTEDSKKADDEEESDKSKEKDTSDKSSEKDASEKPAENGAEDTDKPTIKLASFSTMGTSTENGHSEENEDGCYSCSKIISNVYEAIVWETMQFCDEVKSKFSMYTSTTDHYLLFSVLPSKISGWHVKLRLV